MKIEPFEQHLRQKGYARIAGIDEAGRGPLAGPVVASAVVLNKHIPEGLTDSKKLSVKKRELLFEQLRESDCDFGIGVVEQSDIDKMNILQATVLAMKKAIGALRSPPDFLLVDGSYLPEFIHPAQAITKGDSRCLSIAAASIIAKVTRDNLMQQLDPFFPGYGFAKHKGYGTKQHLEAIEKYGPTPVHRLTFGGVREHLPKLRREKKALGKWGEDYACFHLWKKGARIVQRNYHAGKGSELDVVAVLNGSLRFIEVKTASPSDFSVPEEWVDEYKERRIHEAAEHFLYHHDEYRDMACQFDVAAIEVQNSMTKVRYYENAFSG
ncbi:MAG: Ribonuclease HII [Candidatus Marinimicrobia bacterium]|nr:Ribonuclease HII [Candidatus Neomarinimicrobiota bacterium]